jgi:long-chain acyl-CoA synthetase
MTCSLRTLKSMDAKPTTIAELVSHQHVNRGEALFALDTESGSSLTYSELEKFADQLANTMRTAGVPVGAHVALLMPNGVGTMALLIGLMARGYSVNPINLLCNMDQMSYIVDHAQAHCLIYSPDWESTAKALGEKVLPGASLLCADPHGTNQPSIQRAGDPNSVLHHPPELALLMYTSGTTGKPKGVMLSQANLLGNASAISQEHALTESDRVYAVLPLYHINAFAVTMLAPLWHGGSAMIPPKFSAKQFWPQVAQYQCTWINVVPTIISYLLEHGDPAQTDKSGIRFCRSASAPLPPEHHRQFESLFGIGIIETMGLTETVAPSFSNPLEQARRKIGSVGRASGCEARVVDENGRPLPNGEIGEVIIKGPNVTMGYFRNPEATTASFYPGGWLRTGDLGKVDDDGFFHITGRIKELIIKGGENIAPREIDEVLLKHPDVLDAATVGIPHPHYGQTIGACIIPKENASLTAESIMAWAREKLGDYKCPSIVKIVQDLPRGPSGKVQRLKLVPQFEAS